MADWNDGYNNPIGICTQESRRMHIEANTITGSSVDENDPKLTYGMVINKTNEDAGSDAASLVHMNTIDGVNLAIQFEGDNRGDVSLGGGTKAECNDFGQNAEVHNHDVAVATNFISGGSLDFGLMRDQGSCDFPWTLAGNSFSQCDASALEHWCFDNNALPENPGFLYNDVASRVPASGCHNIALPILPCQLLVERECTAIAGTGVAWRRESLEYAVTRMTELNDEYSSTTDSLERATLLVSIRNARNDLNLARNHLARHMIEFHTMDSLVALLTDTTNGAGIEELIAAYIEREQFDEADSLIQVLLDREGTGAAQLAYLYQLRSGLRMNNSELTEAQIAALDSLVQANPLGAWSAKTMLRVLRGHPYKRIPWMLNDTIAGYRSSSQTHVRTSHLTILPNPADQMVLVRSIKPMYSVAVIGADGRICLRLAFAGELEVQFDISALAPGPYLLRVGTVGSETIERIIVH